MATIQRPLKTYGTRKYVDEVAAAPGNYDPILANEVDGDLDTVYTAWNNELAQGILWSISGAALTPVDATKRLLIPGPTTAETTDQAAMCFGQRTQKGRLTTLPGLDFLSLSLNERYNNTSWIQDDAAVPGWQIILRSDSDALMVRRFPAGSVTPANLLTLDNAGSLTITGSYKANRCGILTATAGGASDMISNDGSVPAWDGSKYALIYRQDYASGVHVWYTTSAPGGGYVEKMRVAQNGDIAIAGANATKASGTAWINPSDRRLKDSIEDYTTGLDAILALRPRRFMWNGKGGSTAGLVSSSFIADEVQDVLPEMVGTTRTKLNADDEDDTEIQTLDTSNLILVVVNALKELDTRLRAVEAQ